MTKPWSASITVVPGGHKQPLIATGSPVSKRSLTGHRPWELGKVVDWRMRPRLFTPSRASKMMLAPLPPSPPSGPPRGTYFSRRRLEQPSPPLPACNSIWTRSTNILKARCWRERTEAEPDAKNKRPTRIRASRQGESWGFAGGFATSGLPGNASKPRLEVNCPPTVQSLPEQPLIIKSLAQTVLLEDVRLLLLVLESGNAKTNEVFGLFHRVTGPIEVQLQCLPSVRCVVALRHLARMRWSAQTPPPRQNRGSDRRPPKSPRPRHRVRRCRCVYGILTRVISTEL